MKGVFSIGLVLTALLAAAVAIPMEPDLRPEIVGEKAIEKGKLNVITITQEEIEGEYHSSMGGIHFRSVVKGEYHFLSITTADGEPLVIAKQPHNSTTLMTLSGTDFLIMNDLSDSGLTKYTDYVVPNVFNKNVEKALKRDQFSTNLLEQLDTEAVNQTRQNAVESLALRPEIELCMSAAQALGDLGVIGSQNPAAMPFYALTLRLTKYRNILLTGVDFAMNDNNYRSREGVQLEGRQKRSSCRLAYLCPYGDCPYYGYGNDCRGMCGIGCTCYSWICGDCCVHQGCRDHDYCCERYGYTNWSCISVWNVACDAAYRCSFT